jgi:hypothetical protein
MARFAADMGGIVTADMAHRGIVIKASSCRKLWLQRSKKLRMRNNVRRLEAAEKRQTLAHTWVMSSSMVIVP